MDSLYYNDLPYDVLIDNDGYLITNGRYYPDPGQTGGGWIRHNFIKTDTAGNQIWNLIYGANDYYYGWPWTAKKSSTGSYYEVGNHIIIPTGYAPAFVKVLHDGTQSYNSTLLSGTTYGGLSSIDFLNDSLMVMVGGWTINDTSHDAFFKTDTLGNVKKIEEIFHISNSYINATKTFDDKFVAVGNDATGGSWKIYAVKVNSELEYDSIYTQPFTYDSFCPHPIVSDTVNPDCENVFVGIDEPFKNPETTRLKVYPNPAKDKITVEMPKYLVVTNTGGAISSTTVYHRWKSVILEVYDLFGRKVLEKEIPRPQSQAELDVSYWQRGMYYFRLVYGDAMVAGEKVIVE
jgi:hypothetical protein